MSCMSEYKVLDYLYRFEKATKRNGEPGMRALSLHPLVPSIKLSEAFKNLDRRASVTLARYFYSAILYL